MQYFRAATKSDNPPILDEEDRARVSRLFYLQLYSSVLNAEKRAVEERLQAKSQLLKGGDQADVSFLNFILVKV